ncbi:hypothetical protein EV13_1484 [Prochlorococcus sp. MIT 0702]|nr:hypothetical protein EV12_0680 [Prochlorococcus sp. MIT 0701]KGG28740.1 hypothetical protein EV13_1484 [Prochlorococcus sp. MIT 0702]KGG35919.1 hypothetical protein EV14_0713 [Prochlorococcus sp. MIT 0703]
MDLKEIIICRQRPAQELERKGVFARHFLNTIKQGCLSVLVVGSKRSGTIDQLDSVVIGSKQMLELIPVKSCSSMQTRLSCWWSSCFSSRLLRLAH